MEPLTGYERMQQAILQQMNKQKPQPENVEVGTFDYLLQRWNKRTVKRIVSHQEVYGTYQTRARAWKGTITHRKETITVYTRDDLPYWTMFLEDVLR